MANITVDVSEVKGYRECKRKWGFQSRNRWHLASKAPAPALAFGTLFHECLHALYLGGSLESVQEMIDRELVDPAELRTMHAMVKGYACGPLLRDLEEYYIIDIEYRFSLEDFIPGADVVGSIDMLAISKEDFLLYGFEHKSAKSFRPQAYMWLDEQPRTYCYALHDVCKKINSGELKFNWPEEVKEYLAEGGKIELGGVFVNEVKKVQRVFEDCRTLCIYGEQESENYKKSFQNTCHAIKSMVDGGGELPQPEPGYMKCNMCNFVSMCQHYGYANPELEEVLAEFVEEYAVREYDHLDEKSERMVDNSSEK